MANFLCGIIITDSRRWQPCSYCNLSSFSVRKMYNSGGERQCMVTKQSFDPHTIYSSISEELKLTYHLEKAK